MDLLISYHRVWRLSCEGGTAVETVIDVIDASYGIEEACREALERLAVHEALRERDA